MWGPAALQDCGQTQSHKETEGHKSCHAREAQPWLCCSAALAQAAWQQFATFSQQHCPPTNEVLISTNESTPANQSAKVTGTPNAGSNSGTRWHRILHRCGPESRGHFRRVPQICGKTKTLTHSYICKYLVSGVQSGLQFTKRLFLLPVTDGPPVPRWPWGTQPCAHYHLRGWRPCSSSASMWASCSSFRCRSSCSRFSPVSADRAMTSCPRRAWS